MRVPSNKLEQRAARSSATPTTTAHSSFGRSEEEHEGADDVSIANEQAGAPGTPPVQAREEIRIDNIHNNKDALQESRTSRRRRFGVTNPTFRVVSSIPIPRRERTVTTTSPTSNQNSPSSVTSNTPLLTSEALHASGLRSTLTRPSDTRCPFDSVPNGPIGACRISSILRVFFGVFPLASGSGASALGPTVESRGKVLEAYGATAPVSSCEDEEEEVDHGGEKGAQC